MATFKELSKIMFTCGMPAKWIWVNFTGIQSQRTGVLRHFVILTYFVITCSFYTKGSSILWCMEATHFLKLQGCRIFSIIVGLRNLWQRSDANCNIFARKTYNQVRRTKEMLKQHQAGQKVTIEHFWKRLDANCYSKNLWVRTCVFPN